MVFKADIMQFRQSCPKLFAEYPKNFLKLQKRSKNFFFQNFFSVTMILGTQRTRIFLILSEKLPPKIERSCSKSAKIEGTI